MHEIDAKSRYVTLVWLGWLILAAVVLFAPTRLVFEKLARVLPRHYDLFLLALLVLAVAVVVYVYFLRRAFWKFELASLAAAATMACLVYEPWGTVVSLWLVAAGYLIGNCLLDAFGIGVIDPLEEVGLGLTLGLGTLSFVLFFLGTLNLFSPWTFAALLTLPFLIGYRRLPALARLPVCLHRKWAATEELRSPLVGIGVGFAVVFVIFALTTALTPSISYDSVKFHLVLTELFAAQGGTAPMASIYYSFFPQGVEVLLTAGHALAGQAAAQIIAPVFFPLSLLTLVLLGRQCGWNRASVVAGVLAGLSIPVVHWTGSNVKNDLALAAYQLACLSAYLMWRQTKNFRWAIVGAVLLGFSLNVKQPALLAVAPLGLLLLLAAWRQKNRLAAVVAVIACIALVGSVWQFRSTVPSESGRGSRMATGMAEQVLDEIQDRLLTRPHKWVLVPWTAHFQGRFFFQSVLPNPLGFYLVLFLPALLLAPQGGNLPNGRNRAERPALFFAVSYVIAWTALTGTLLISLRYAVAPILILAAIWSDRLARLWQSGSAAVRVTTSAALIYNFLFCVACMVVLEINWPQIRYLAGDLDKPAYLRAALPGYQAIEALAVHRQPGEKVMSLETCGAAYYPQPWLVECFVVSTDFQSWDRMLEKLEQEKYDYLVAPLSRLTEQLPHSQEIWRGKGITARRIDWPPPDR